MLLFLSSRVIRLLCTELNLQDASAESFTSPHGGARARVRDLPSVLKRTDDALGRGSIFSQ
ncbi:Hypothetical protein SMAX5B_003051 [Scophthalmus maximus]|uniref:Uncharacterized protein n=1 Tax=Scophthalmus maximus TaxID=52904 RepID=A0A2U9CGG0_SCOMX|nr:Hypothetical protein SMAX5B_003051 [Scophthalmus maximus]